MNDNHIRQRRARFTQGGVTGIQNSSGDDRRGRWTGHFPLEEAVAVARLNSLAEQEQKQPKEDR